MKKILKKMVLCALMFTSVQASWSGPFSDENYIQYWGKLKIVNNQISSELGEKVQLKGWSTRGDILGSSCYAKSSLEKMKSWGANSVRLAIDVNLKASEEEKEKNISAVKEFLDWTEALGIYCVVDWNFTSSENPQVSLDDNIGGKGAQYFFSQIASYAKAENYKHVIYELCGEPGSENWTDIKDFASAVIPSIQTNDEGALMIVATPQWCQLIDAAVDKEVADGAYNDVLLYSFHYSACSHQQFLPKLNSVSSSLPVVVSEWTAVNYDGTSDEIVMDGKQDFSICSTEANDLLAACSSEDKKISWWYGYWSDQFVGSSSLRDCSDINDSNLLAAGRFILPTMIKPSLEDKENQESTVIEDVDRGDFTIYPNPASGEISVTLNSDEEATIEIISVLGQVVYASEVKSGNKLSINLPEGSYVVCIKSSGKVSQQKLVIE